MMYRIFADLVVTAHFAYIAFVLFGLVLTLAGWMLKWQWVRNRWFRGIHVLMILVVVAEAWAGVVCPLTTLEHWLRTMAGQQTYRGSFVANWLHDMIFFDASPQFFTIAYSLFGSLVLWTWYVVPPRWSANSTENVGSPT